MKESRDSFEIIMMIKEIYSAIHNQLANYMKESGLTPQQILVVKLIAHHGEMTISQLCEELSLSKATVSGIVQRLEEAGYVKKEKRDEDKRNTYVSFSEKGKVFAITFKQMMNESFGKVCKHLTEEETTQIKESLRLLRRKIKGEEK